MGEERDKDVSAGRGAGTALSGAAGTREETHPKGEEERGPATEHSTADPTEAEHEASEHSPWPIILALGLLLVGFGLLNQVAIAVLGGIVVLVALVGWLWQPWTS